MKKIILFLWLLAVYCFTQPVLAQTTSLLTIDECYTRARENYPMIRQLELVQQSGKYSVTNLSKGYLPEFAILGHATYQSAVTAVPARIPGLEMPPIDKDQYKIYGELNQVIYDGGVIHQEKLSEEYQTVAQEKQVEVELYKLKERINQLFFGVLLLDHQLEQVAILKKDILAGIDKKTAAVNNGVALKSELDVLKAEQLKNDQREIELLSARVAYLNMLSQFINKPLPAGTKLQEPAPLIVTSEINRPELQMYDARSKSLEARTSLIRAHNMPKLKFFVQGGYGRPALNMLNNEFETFYMGGIRLQWNLSGWYTFHNDKELISINRNMNTLEKETFLFNTRLSMLQQTEEITKLQQMMGSDEQIISLRTNVKNAAAAQLENGVITSSDYLREVNALDTARQNKNTHAIQLLMAQYNQKTLTGN